jgi:hypothetical protein
MFITVATLVAVIIICCHSYSLPIIGSCHSYPLPMIGIISNALTCKANDEEEEEESNYQTTVYYLLLYGWT